MKSKSVPEALEYVAQHPPQSFEPTVDMPTWEIIGQLLYLIANSGNPRHRGSVNRATRAQKMIWDRKVGRRRAGTDRHARLRAARPRRPVPSFTPG